MLGGHDARRAAAARCRSCTITSATRRGSSPRCAWPRSRPTARRLALRLAGHPPPLLISGDGVERRSGPRRPAARRRRRTPTLAGARARAARALVAAALHRRADRGTDRRRRRSGSATQGWPRWCAALERATIRALVAALVERAEELNGGPLLDDVAAFVVQRAVRPPRGRWFALSVGLRGRRRVGRLGLERDRAAAGSATRACSSPTGSTRRRSPRSDAQGRAASTRRPASAATR